MSVPCTGLFFSNISLNVGLVSDIVLIVTYISHCSAHQSVLAFA